MKNSIIIMFLMLVPLLSYGQEISVDSLLHKADSIRNACAQLKDKDPNKAKGLEQALVLQDSVYNFMADSVRYFSAFEKDAHAYKFFACTDASVFTHRYVVIDTRILPKYMQEHYLAITAVRQLAMCIESMENKIKAAEADKDVAETDRKSFVAIKIKSEIDKANEILEKIDNQNLASFSTEQEQYYQELSNKLTDILNKYIF